MPVVDREEVRKLAQLAQLALTDDELDAAAGHLDRLLAYLKQVQAIDVTGTPETVHVEDDATPLRPDDAQPGFPRDVMTAGAPAAPAGLFEVPKVLAARGPAAVEDAAREPSGDEEP